MIACILQIEIYRKNKKKEIKNNNNNNKWRRYYRAFALSERGRGSKRENFQTKWGQVDGL